MKKYVFAIAVSGIYTGNLFADSLSMRIGSNIVRIDATTKQAPEQTIRELQERVWRLEQAVHQLQNKVFDLSDKPSTVAQKTYSCYIKTAFKGTFTGKGTTLNEAKGATLKACNNGDGGLSCSELNLKCDE